MVLYIVRKEKEKNRYSKEDSEKQKELMTDRDKELRLQDK